MLEERKHIRAVAKEIRLQEQRAKAAAREEAMIARQAKQQLQDDLKLAREGKQRAPTPPKVIPKDAEDVSIDFLSTIDASPTPARSRRTRQIKLPKRYCN